MMFLNVSLLCQENSPLLCSDGIDNDGDGNIDCMDNECGDLPNNGCSTCFNDGSSFADVVLSYSNPCSNSLNTNPDAAIGVSNFSTVPSDQFVTLGNGGSIALGFTNNILTNSGNSSADLWVFEVGPLVESSYIALRPIPGSGSESILIAEGVVDSDSDGFYEFGLISGSTSSIDIDNFLSGEYESGALKFDAVKVTDFPGGGCSGGYTGADIDAVCALSSVACESILTEINKSICLGEDCEGYTNSGVYVDTLLAASGCDSVRILNLTVSDLEIFNINETSATCGDSNGLIAVNAGGGIGNLSYSINNGEDQSSNIFAKLSPGSYLVRVTDENGCSLEEEVMIVDRTSPVDGEVFGDLNFCQGDSILLTATGGSSYNWSTGDSTPSVFVKVAGEHKVTITNSDGCMDSISVNVTSLELPVITINGMSEICEGDTSFLSASGAVMYMWSTGDSTKTVAITKTGEYFVTGVDTTGCANEDSIFVSVNDLPVVELSLQKDSFCVNDDPAVLSGGSPDGGTYTGPGIIGGIFNPQEADLDSNLIIYSFIDSLECINSDSSIITVIDDESCNVTSVDFVRDNNLVNIFPNPSGGAFTVLIEGKPRHITTKLVDFSGRIIREFTGVANTLNFHDVPTGVYVIQILANNLYSSTTIVIN